MPIYFIIYTVQAINGSPYQIKHVQRVIKCLLSDVEDMFIKNKDLLQSNSFPYHQVDIVFRPDNNHLEELSQ